MEESYIKIRKRLSHCYDIKNMSDKEIIEVLDKEIEQYRNRIENQNRIIDELSKREIKSEVVELDNTDEIIDNNIKEITTINTFADGKLIQTITKYEYKEDN